MFSSPSDRSGEREVSFGSAVLARGFALQHLKKACVFWGLLALLCALAAAGLFSAELWKPYAPVGFAALITLFLISAYKGVLSLLDLLDAPISYDGQVAEKRTSIFLYKLFFLADRYYLRIERGKDHRPLTYGTGTDLPGGWFLAGKGYHDILSGDDHVRGTLYPRTRLIASLVKI